MTLLNFEHACRHIRVFKAFIKIRVVEESIFVEYLNMLTEKYRKVEKYTGSTWSLYETSVVDCFSRHATIMNDSNNL